MITFEDAKVTWRATLKYVKIVLRRLRLVRINRNFLVFLVFLGVSIVFWCLQTLQEDATITLSYTINLVGLPKDVIFTSELPEEIQINVSGRGYDIVQYNMRNNSTTLDINYADLTKKDTKIEISQATIRKAVVKKVGQSLQFVSSMPSFVDVYYTTGKCKRVPVIFDGKVTTGLQHVLCGIKLSPDSVDIYAPQRLYDSIRSISTTHIIYKEVEDTITRSIALTKTHGVKCVPDSVDMTICVDLFTEKKFSVPIYCENIPKNKVLRTFPLRANVTCHVSTTMYNEVSENDFIVVVDYKSLNTATSSCKLHLRSKPEGVSHVTVSPETVEFVVENCYE